MKLLNDSLEQRLAIRLRKDIEREYGFRLFLDTNVEYGVNRKAMVLQMYEVLLANGFIDEDLRLRHTPISSRQIINSVIQQNESSFKDSIRVEKQSDSKSVDPSDFGDI